MACLEIILPNIEIVKQQYKIYSKKNDDNDNDDDDEEHLIHFINQATNNRYDINSIGIFKNTSKCKNIKGTHYKLIIELDKTTIDDYDDFADLCKLIISNGYKDNENVYYCIYSVYNEDIAYRWFNFI